MFTDDNTSSYTPSELAELNAELTHRLVGITDEDERRIVEQAFSDEVARR